MMPNEPGRVVILITGDGTAGAFMAEELLRLKDDTTAAAVATGGSWSNVYEIRGALDQLKIPPRASRGRGRYWESPRFQGRKRGK